MEMKHPPIDPYEHIVICELCEDYWCVKCEQHWADCDCPGIGDNDD